MSRRRGRAATLAACIAAILAAAPPGAAPLAADEGRGFALGGSVGERAYASWAGTGGLDPADIAYGSATGLELGIEAEGGGSGAATARARAVGDLLLRSGAAAAGGETLAARVRELGVALDLGFASLEGGRVIVNWSRGSPWSPVDLFADYDRSGPTALRLGADALVLRAPVGATGAVEAVAAPSLPSASLAEGRYALRASGYALGVDAGALCARDGATGDWLLGADFKADLEAGIYGEALCALSEGNDARYRAALGADWSAALGEGGGKLLLQAEYCYDGMPFPAARGAPDSHNAYASLAWAGDRSTASLGASYSWPSGAAGATLVAALDAAPGASLVAYARASRRSAADYAEAGLSLELRF